MITWSLGAGLTNMCKWSVRLGPMAGGSTPHVITATSAAHGSIKLSDVLFGDVWMCGGQSNMQFSVPQVYTHIHISLTF